MQLSEVINMLLALLKFRKWAEVSTVQTKQWIYTSPLILSIDPLVFLLSLPSVQCCIPCPSPFSQSQSGSAEKQHSSKWISITEQRLAQINHHKTASLACHFPKNGRDLWECGGTSAITWLSEAEPIERGTWGGCLCLGESPSEHLQMDSDSLEKKQLSSTHKPTCGKHLKAGIQLYCFCNLQNIYNWLA